MSESDEFGTSVSSLETNSMAGSNSEFPLADIAKTNEIKLENLSFHEKLGSGQFGDVYRGSFKKNVIISRQFLSLMNTQCQELASILSFQFGLTELIFEFVVSVNVPVLIFKKFVTHCTHRWNSTFIYILVS